MWCELAGGLDLVLFLKAIIHRYATLNFAHGTCFWDGRSCMCNEVWKAWEGRQSVHITLKEFENVSAFSNHTEREDTVNSQDDHTLFASLGAAALSHTHCSRPRLHGIETAFTLCLLICFHTRLLALSSSLPSQLLPFWRRDSETASTTTALRMINLRISVHNFL